MISLPIMAQSVLQNYNIEVSAKIETMSKLESHISNLLLLETQNISIKKIHETESLTAKHFTFSLYFNGAAIHKAYIKAHINKDQLFFIQHNYNPELFNQFQSSSINKKAVYNSLYESFVINNIEEVYALNEENVFTKAVLVNYFIEAKDVYKERLYFGIDDFIEKDLKVHFAPKDTMLKGSVFMPDPLTSSENEYGVANYRDEFIKDTSMLIIKTIPNAGQNAVSAGLNDFTIYGTTFSVDDKTVNNTFSGSDIYFVFEDIYIDVDGVVLGYNTFFTDTLGYKSKIIIEDYGFTALNSEQVNIEVKGDFSSSAFRLKNNIVEISDFSLPVAPPYSSAINDFSFSRSNNFFEGINAFYHINNFHDYIENLGFTDLDPTKIVVDVHGNAGADNSFFTNLPTPRLIFGDGGVDDAEDADVIVHEYTHALSYFASPNTNNGAERKALDEALGDYFCSTYSASFNNYNKNNVFSWDGHNDFWGGRISNSDSTYKSLDLSKSIYFNAQIMSSTFMDIYEKLGREITDVLILESMYYNVSENSFFDLADNLLRIDSLLYNGKYKCEIFNVLVNRKVKFGLCIGKTIVKNEGIILMNTEAFTLGTGNATIIINEENFEHLDYWISNSTGQIIAKKQNITEAFLEIETDFFSNGIYFLRIETNNTKYKTKLVKAN